MRLLFMQQCYFQYFHSNDKTNKPLLWTKQKQTQFSVIVLSIQKVFCFSLIVKYKKAVFVSAQMNVALSIFKSGSFIVKMVSADAHLPPLLSVHQHLSGRAGTALVAPQWFFLSSRRTGGAPVFPPAAAALMLRCSWGEIFRLLVRSYALVPPNARQC